MIVVDTNIICYLYLESELSSLAEQTLLKDSEWAAPLLWRSEIRNVLAFQIRKKLIGLDDAQQIMGEAAKLMEGREYEIASYNVLSLAASSECSAYDCEFVALAIDLGVRMVTADRQILAQFPETAVALGAF